MMFSFSRESPSFVNFCNCVSSANRLICIFFYRLTSFAFIIQHFAIFSIWCGEFLEVTLSAILDLYDRRIVSYRIGDSNNNSLVFETFDEAVKANPDAHPLFHSDRGFQYTSKGFHDKLIAANMRQSMSRVGRCIDNGPMEGFWGILKSEMYYLRKFTSRDDLISAIERYLHFYNNKRYQQRLRCMTPMEFHRAAA